MHDMRRFPNPLPSSAPHFSRRWVSMGRRPPGLGRFTAPCRVCCHDEGLSALRMLVTDECLSLSVSLCFSCERGGRPCTTIAS
eukprot:scaffold191944_cov35-Tisochrysis_lutea.AAC.1